MKKLTLYAAMKFLFIALLARSAFGQLLPPKLDAVVYTAPNIVRSSGLGTIFSTSPTGEATATMVGGFDPGVSVSISGTATALEQFEARASEDIYFTVIAPGFISVPITISGSWSRSSTGDWGYGAEGGIYLYSYLSPDVLLEQAIGNGDFAYKVNLPLYPGDGFQYFDLQIVAEVVNFSAIGLGSSDAMIDPIVTIDPTFLANNLGISIIADSGFLSPSPVPEPEAYGFFGVVFLVGLITWRRGKIKGVNVEWR